jgi:hypothetical protein
LFLNYNFLIFFLHQESLLQKLAPKIGDSFDVNDPDEYRENLIKVEVYYEEFNFEQIMERPSYPVSVSKYIQSLLF